MQSRPAERSKGYIVDLQRRYEKAEAARRTFVYNRPGVTCFDSRISDYAFDTTAARGMRHGESTFERRRLFTASSKRSITCEFSVQIAY